MPSANHHSHVIWQDGQPYSAEYGDIYFSSDSGLEETQHVFLQHNRLQPRWQALAAPHFTIAETGFGTGLNFLCAWELWRKSAPKDARLHFISVERYPLTTAELQQALALWPQLAELSAALLQQYRMLTPGWHRLEFDQGRVCLTLIIGDAQECLPQIKAGVDAWFLDGFAPAKNPEMWQPALFVEMARLSKPGATFATFTSAGIVKRGLQQAGFEVRKTAGFGRKREMLCGEFHVAGSQPESSESEHAIVIGGGIAGTASAHALASRGWQVTLIERHAAVAQEASGNPLGVLYPRLAGQDIVLSRLAMHGYLHTLRLLQRLGLAPDQYAQCGLLQTAYDARELARCQAVAARQLPDELVRFVDTDEASRLAGFALHHPALHFPAAGWVDPVAFCGALAAHPNIRLISATHALKLHRNAHGWQVWDAQACIAEAPVVIVACANRSAGFAQTAHLPLEPVRGQITFAAATEASQQLKTILCSDGYASPAHVGRHFIGATFSANEDSLDVRESDHEANLAMLRRLCPDLYHALDPSQLSGRAALRCATPDYLPMAGPMLDSAALLAQPPRHTADPSSLPWLDGLYINTGHGSKGLINAPLCAEMLASAICGEPAPVDRKLLAALDPNRFLLRKLGLKRLVLGLAARP